MKKDNIDISIICLTYNQVDYVKRMLNGIMEQETQLIYEVIIHDDASVDGTQDYLCKMRDQYPDVIKLYIEDENKFSKEIDFFSEIIVNSARGKYIAICEGDDFWIDKSKLAMQYDALEIHPECDMCACRALMISSDGEKKLGEIRPATMDGVLPIENVIAGGGNYIASAGLFFRKNMFNKMMDFEKIRSLDYSHQIKGALRGGIYYIDRPMVAYRRYSKGSVTENITNNSEKMIRQCEQEKAILRTLDIETNGKYHEVIMARLKDYEVNCFDQLINNRKKIAEDIFCHNSFKHIYIWGMGVRGRELEKYCSHDNIPIEGVCDIIEQNIGKFTNYGNKIMSTVDAMKKADLILASVEGAYSYIRSNWDGTVINMQKYMPKI